MMTQKKERQCKEGKKIKQISETLTISKHLRDVILIPPAAAWLPVQLNRDFHLRSLSSTAPFHRSHQSAYFLRA
jgi:hypothetical protein